MVLQVIQAWPETEHTLVCVQRIHLLPQTNAEFVSAFAFLRDGATNEKSTGVLSVAIRRSQSYEPRMDRMKLENEYYYVLNSINSTAIGSKMGSYLYTSICPATLKYKKNVLKIISCLHCVQIRMDQFSLQFNISLMAVLLNLNFIVLQHKTQKELFAFLEWRWSRAQFGLCAICRLNNLFLR